MTLSPHPRRTLAARAMALVAAASVALTGCSGVGGSAEAARVGEYVITDRQVQTATQELASAESPSFQAPAPSSVLSVMLLEPVLRPIAVKAKKATSDSQAELILENLGVKDPSPATVRAIRTNLDLEAVGQEGMAKAVEALGSQEVEINPRYGSFDAANPGQGIQPYTPDWVKDVADEDERSQDAHAGHDH